MTISEYKIIDQFPGYSRGGRFFTTTEKHFSHSRFQTAITTNVTQRFLNGSLKLLGDKTIGNTFVPKIKIVCLLYMERFTI